MGEPRAAQARRCRACRRRNAATCPHPRRVAEYVACPACACASLGLQVNGRVVRHSVGFGSVEPRAMLERRGWRTTVCKGSGALLR